MVELTEGERWARTELERLIDRRFSPAAVAGFLAASFRRSADIRRARPELARQARRWTAIGAAAWLLPPFRARARAGLAWWALVSLMLDWHLGMVETPAAVGAELARLGAGLGYALVVYFGRAEAPDARVTRAARLTTPVRAAGLIAAGLGRRRLASALLAAGSAWSIASLVYASCGG